MKNSGCYKCEKRFVGCHGTCDKYLEYKTFLENIKNKKNEERLTYATHKKVKKGYKAYG